MLHIQNASCFLISSAIAHFLNQVQQLLQKVLKEKKKLTDSKIWPYRTVNGEQGEVENHKSRPLLVTSLRPPVQMNGS